MSAILLFNFLLIWVFACLFQFLFVFSCIHKGYLNIFLVPFWFTWSVFKYIPLYCLFCDCSRYYIIFTSIPIYHCQHFAIKWSVEILPLFTSLTLSQLQLSKTFPLHTLRTTSQNVINFASTMKYNREN